VTGPAIGGIVLAAGESRRMGGRPKALLEHDGVPLVRRVARSMLEAGLRDVVVVLGHRADQVAAAVAGLPVRAVVNADYAAGRSSSLRCGLAAQSHCQAVAIALADMPLLGADDVRAVLQAFAQRTTGRRALVPRYGDERGHPVVLAGDAAREIQQHQYTGGARDWLDAHPDEVQWLDVDHARHVVDVDAPEDIERIAGCHGVQLRWPDPEWFSLPSPRR
jgi:CTP:molybdopterin cytidylyltransferase MocA